MQDDQYDYYYDIDPGWCDVEFCNSHIESCMKNRQCGHGICRRHPGCDTYGCPCPKYKKKDLNISVSCTTSQSVMNYDLSKLFNLSLNTSLLSISVSMQVSKYLSQISSFSIFNTRKSLFNFFGQHYDRYFCHENIWLSKTCTSRIYIITETSPFQFFRLHGNAIL